MFNGAEVPACIKCPLCQAEVVVPDGMASLQISCSKCGHILSLTVPLAFPVEPRANPTKVEVAHTRSDVDPSSEECPFDFGPPEARLPQEGELIPITLREAGAD